MPSHNKVRPVQTVRKRQNRGRLYLIALVIIVILAVGLYVYASSLPPGPPDFTISAPAGLTIHAGNPFTATINITGINRFDGTVHLSAASSPSGLSITINPVNVTGPGTAMITMSSQTNNTYSLTITGSSGSLTHKISPTVATPVYATLQTSNGTLYVELYRAQTPKTVQNFVNLAESHFYDNLVWHRIAQSPPVIQTGDPNTRYGNTSRATWGSGGSSQTVPLEIDSSLHNNLGYLGMARTSDPNSGTSQFYVNMANNNFLDGQYTVFGKVIGSMNAANIIWHLPTTNTPQADQPVDTPFLLSVTITGM